MENIQSLSLSFSCGGVDQNGEPINKNILSIDGDLSSETMTLLMEQSSRLFAKCTEITNRHRDYQDLQQKIQVLESTVEDLRDRLSRVGQIDQIEEGSSIVKDSQEDVIEDDSKSYDVVEGMIMQYSSDSIDPMYKEIASRAFINNSSVWVMGRSERYRIIFFDNYPVCSCKSYFYTSYMPTPRLQGCCRHIKSTLELIDIDPLNFNWNTRPLSLPQDMKRLGIHEFRWVPDEER